MSNADAIILQYQPLLFSIAYKLTGSVPDSEDIVQDTFLKWLGIDQSKVLDVKAYLAKSVANQAINYLKSVKQTKEIAFSNWYEENISKRYEELDFNKFDLKNELEDAFSNFMKKLTPSERGVYLLKEVFQFSYADLTDIFEKKAENCRQLFSRAQKRLTENSPRFNVDPPSSKQLFEKFQAAYQNFDLQALVEKLKEDARGV